MKPTNWFQFTGTYTGHVNIVRILVENGADINAVNADKRSALYSAIDAGKYHIEWWEKLFGFSFIPLNSQGMIA